MQRVFQGATVVVFAAAIGLVGFAAGYVAPAQAASAIQKSSSPTAIKPPPSRIGARAAPRPATPKPAIASVPRSGGTSGKLNSMSDMGQEKQMRMQTYMDHRNRAYQALSNTMKKTSQTNSTIIKNMK